MLSILGILIAVVSGWACLLFAKKCIRSWHASCLYMLRCVITYKDKSDMLSILGILIAVVSGWACLLFAKKCISALEKCVFREDS